MFKSGVGVSITSHLACGFRTRDVIQRQLEGSTGSNTQTAETKQEMVTGWQGPCLVPDASASVRTNGTLNIKHIADAVSSGGHTAGSKPRCILVVPSHLVGVSI